LAASYRLAELARRVGGKVRGNGDRRVEGLATLDAAGPAHLSFFTNARYRKAALATRAGALLVGKPADLGDRDLLICNEPYVALAQLLELFQAVVPAPPAGVSPRAAVSRGAKLGEGVSVGPFAVIEEGAMLGASVVVGPGTVIGRDSRIGEATELRPGVVLYPGTVIGARCLVHSGVVLGGDGFGFATVNGVHRKVPQTGRVVVGDDVEIGANTTVDRGALGETEIGSGAKLDNLVMIAHGVRVGAGSLLAAQAGIAGSTRLGPGVVMAGQSGIIGHLDIAGGTIVAAKSAVFDDTAGAGTVAGVPAVDHRNWKRAQALVRRLPELHRTVKELQQRVAELEARSTADRREDDR